MKKFVSLLLSALMICMLFTGCGNNSTDNGNASSTESEKADVSENAEADSSNSEKENTENKVIKIGVVQLVQHEALDAAYNGFKDTLDEVSASTGYTFEIDYQNAQGDQSNCNTIANKFVNDGVDLILAIATPAALAAQNATKDSQIPVLFTAVTDGADAGLVASNDAPGANVSGTSDLTPVEQQIELLTKLIPDAKNIGILYSSNEDNSVFQANLAKDAATKFSLDATEYTVSNLNEINQVVQSMVGKVDAIYIPTDNAMANGMNTVSNIATENNLPIIAGENGMVVNGALASYGLSYYDLGALTAKQAIKICIDGEDISKMAIEYLDTFDLAINEEIATKLGITIPEELKAELSK